ncbi:MAG: hypothetical protein JKY80_06105 [Mariprofundaceae bacterium]|nr:hypothetical protein [Mariprofundaceae bacterium]
MCFSWAVLPVGVVAGVDEVGILMGGMPELLGVLLVLGELLGIDVVGMDTGASVGCMGGTEVVGIEGLGVPISGKSILGNSGMGSKIFADKADVLRVFFGMVFPFLNIFPKAN